MQPQRRKHSKWKFTEIRNIEEFNFDKNLERFYAMGIYGLTRENIQNSLDGRLPGSDKPVIVKIEIGTINSIDIPGIEEVKERIKNLVGRNEYTRETINHMQSKLDQDEIRYISFEDINTKGLTGARKGEIGSKDDTWHIYAYSKGYHFEEEDEQLEIARGGSHGVGKIASNAASDLHVMYFANCDAYGDQHLGGTVQLIEHEIDGQAYRSTGYFTDITNYNNKLIYVPYENNFHEVFKKDTRGLKIVIPYLRDEYDNEKEIIKSICDSFFIAILEKKLEVHVNDKVINKDTIFNFVHDEKYYIQETSEIKQEFTPLYVDTYLNTTPKKIKVNNIKDSFHFNLYFQYDEQIPKGRVAIVRTIGMKIEDFKVKNNAMKPFNAVLIGGLKEDAYLKSLENESHTKLSRDHINDPKLKKYATRFINNLSREISKVIDEVIQEHNPSDGLMETGDILYVVETQFKKELKDSMGTVKVNEKMSLVKSTGNERRKEKRKQREDKGQKWTPPEENRERNPIKLQKGNQEFDSLEGNNKERYSVYPENVQRIIFDDKEIIKFDFRNSKLLNNSNSCDIALSVIDGMGKEYRDEFDISSSYHEIIDKQTGKSCEFRKDKIKDVQINNGIVELQMKLNHSFNRSLKFIYYVEV